MTWHIRILNPNASPEMTDASREVAQSVASSRVRISASRSVDGPAVVETHTDEVLGAVGILDQVGRGEADGVDGYVIACFGDTGLPVAREQAAGPVVGMTEAALNTAVLLAHRFAIITMPPRTLAMAERVVSGLGLGHRCDVRAIDVDVVAIEAGASAAEAPLLAAARTAVDDGAEAIVLGCAGLSATAELLEAELDVPVIDGIAAATTQVEGLLAQGLSTSRVRTWASPAEQREASS